MARVVLPVFEDSITVRNASAAFAGVEIGGANVWEALQEVEQLPR